MPEFTPQIAMTLGVVLVTVVLFITEWIRVDVVAILVMVALPLLGLVDGRETFQGFSSTAVISIIAVIIIGRGLDHTGVISRAIRPLLRLAGNSHRLTVLVLSGAISIISSFMQNVGAAALFLPAMQRICRQTGTPISKLLMPVGFSAILGGTISLVGSSPLIMLNDLLRPFGIAPFSLFSVTPVGVALVVTGMFYFIFAGRFVLPRHAHAAQNEQPEKNPLIYYPELVELYELDYPVTAPVKDLKVLSLCDRYNVHIVALSYDDGQHKMMPPDREIRLVPGSVFALYASPMNVEQVARELNFIVKPDLDVFAEDLSMDFSGVVEAVVSPHSTFVGKTLMEVRFRHNHLVAPLAIIHKGQTHYTKLGPRVLDAGDVILMYGRWERFQQMRAKRELLFAQSLDHDILHTHEATAAIACFSLSTLLVIFSSLPISVCLMAGALGMILTQVLTIDEAYQGIDWRTVFLLSGLIPLGLAMQKTGAAAWMAHYLLGIVGNPSPMLFIFSTGVITTGMTLVISNVGAAVLLVPLVVDIAGPIGVDPRMAALVVGLAASNAFLLPTHQVNALYMGPGGYTSRDFIKAGAPLSILFLLVLTVVMMLLI